MTPTNNRTALITLTVLGLGITSYLTYAHYDHLPVAFYGSLAGVPVPVIGLIGYSAILVALLAAPTETSRLMTAILALIDFGVSADVAYPRLADLHSCPWCLVSDLIITLLLILAARNIWSDRQTTEPHPDQALPPGGTTITMPSQVPGITRRRSKAWGYYTILAVLSFIAVCSGQVIGLVGTALFGLYALYLYRGGRFVIWFW